MGVRWSDFPCTATSPGPTADGLTSPVGVGGESSPGMQHHAYHPVVVALSTAVDRQVIVIFLLLLTIIIILFSLLLHVVALMTKKIQTLALSDAHHPSNF